MRHMSILPNVNMSRTVTQVNKIHQPFAHGYGHPAGAILDNSKAFAVEGGRLHNMIWYMFLMTSWNRSLKWARYSLGQRDESGEQDVRQKDNRNQVSRQDRSPE